jgi:FtsP/CotA-like multicopper oxidase with cupredoxin domain
MRSVSRRKFIALIAGATAGASAGSAESTVPETSKNSVGTSPAPQDEYAKFNPDITLECGAITKTIAGVKVKLRSYNGQIPGPMIVTKAGVTLKVRVKNLLSQSDSSGWDGDMDVPHEFAHTNLHLHGLDIAPHIFEPPGTSNPLAPIIAIGAGEYKDYSFVIPPDHSPGLNWYHPHSHGSTAVQAVS